jgi:hypothetical protein
MDERFKKAAEQALEKTTEIFDSADRIKGKEFTNRARIVFLTQNMNEAVHHVSVCTNPACKATTAKLVDGMFTKIVALCNEGLSESDSTELENLSIALIESADISRNLQGS